MQSKIILIFAIVAIIVNSVGKFLNNFLKRPFFCFSNRQSMSERRSFERRSEWRSFFRERKVSAVLFRPKERKVSAAQKNWWARAQNALFFALFFWWHSVGFYIQYFAAFRPSKLPTMLLIIWISFKILVKLPSLCKIGNIDSLKLGIVALLQLIDQYAIN